MHIFYTSNKKKSKTQIMHVYMSHEHITEAIILLHLLDFKSVCLHRRQLELEIPVLVSYCCEDTKGTHATGAD